MIEANIVSWVDMGEAIHNLDVYGKKKWIRFFNFIRVLISFKNFSVFVYILFKFFFFLQIMMLTLTNLEDDSDAAVVLLKYISTVIFIQDIVKSKGAYEMAVLITSIATIVTVMCIVYLAISIKINKFYMKLPIYFLNFLNVLIMNYWVGPIVQICILATNCDEGIHIYLGVSCYTNLTHIAVFIVSVVNLLFFLSFSIILSIYFNELGSVSENKVSGRINCNYEIYMNISKILLFIFAYGIQKYWPTNEILMLVMQLFIFINSLFFALYTYHTILFYDNNMNIITLYGWSYIAWYAFIIILKSWLDIYDTSIFIVIGWIIISFILYLIQSHREEYLLTDFNIFEAKNLKDIELFNIKMFNLISIRSIKNKTIWLGWIEKFENFFKTIPEMHEKYTRLCNNEILKKKFNSSLDLPVLSIVYLIYDHHWEKSAFKNDILLAMSYFLINKFKKVYLALYQCSKIKVTDHKQSYFKYILLEEIQEYLINKLTKSNNNESIKHVQIGSVILYDIYTEIFRLKIYDAACNQIDYFDILRNDTSTSKTTENFLKYGEEIWLWRTEIWKWWEKILELNPFSDESEKDYNLYLDTILQDDLLLKAESKKFVNWKTAKLSERNNVYHSMFNKNISSVCLVDGHNMVGKILYVSPNFPTLFSYSSKEILNCSIEDLMPNVIATFHKELMDNSIKYSNVNKIFTRALDVIIKGKTGGIFSVKMYVKCVPNFSYGWVYMIYISKNIDGNFWIVLDDQYRINSWTDLLAPSGTPYVINSNYGLTNAVVNHNIAMIIPEILTDIEYKDGVFSIPKTDIDLKGNLYPVSGWRELDEKINLVYEKIKQIGKLTNDDENKHDTVQEYDDWIREITSRYQKPFSIFFRVETKTFMGGKYKYHRLYITNDLIAWNENSQFGSLAKSANTSNGWMKALNNNEGDINNPQILEIDSRKLIRLKGIGFDSERKQLLGNDIPADGKAPEGREHVGPKSTPLDNTGNLILNTPGKEDFIESSSVLTKSTVDSTGFNKLKYLILEKKEVISIRIMRYVSTWYGLITILFIYLSYSFGKSNFNVLSDYIDQNSFFNTSKISSSCVYIMSINNYWLKNKKIIDCDEWNQKCEVNENCQVFYNEWESNCILNIKTWNENSSYFYEDFKEKLGKKIDVSLSVNKSPEKEVISIDWSNLYTMLISTGLNFYAGRNKYFDPTDTYYDAMNNNLMEQSHKIITEPEWVGFETAEKERNISKNQSKVNSLPLIADALFFGLLIIGITIWLFQLYQTECFYLEKLIKFNSPGFELYLKKLDDLKKKLRNEDTSEVDKPNESELNVVEVDVKKEKKEEDNNHKNNNNEVQKKGKANKKDIKEDKAANEKNKKDTLSKKKKREKMNKLQQMKNQKLNLMTAYFFKWNFIFAFEIISVFIVSWSYFLIIYIIESKYKGAILTLDESVNSIVDVYKTSFDIFLHLKDVWSEFVDYKIQYVKMREFFAEETEEEFVLHGISYNFNTYNDASSTIIMVIPPNNEISTPKFENWLMKIINDGSLDKEQISWLNTWYNGNACSVLFSMNNEMSICENFWSKIWVKGMEQSITQMSVIINTVWDEWNALNFGTKTLCSVIGNGSSYSQYEFFVQYYWWYAFYKSINVFETLKLSKINSIFNIYWIILIVYIITVFILIIVVIRLIYMSKKKFNSFLNFIGILPIKYIYEDESMYKEILKLEQKLY